MAASTFSFATDSLSSDSIGDRHLDLIELRRRRLESVSLSSDRANREPDLSSPSDQGLRLCTREGGRVDRMPITAPRVPHEKVGAALFGADAVHIDVEATAVEARG